MRAFLATCAPFEAATVLFHTINNIFMDVVKPIAMARDQSRTGGIFAFWRIDKQTSIAVPIVCFSVGIVPTDRYLIFLWHANEKPVRLSGFSEHISSWQSRDDSAPDTMQQRYGGAISCGHPLFFSFSGLSEHEDEMLCVIGARRFGLITRDQTFRIIRASNNQLLINYQAEVGTAF